MSYTTLVAARIVRAIPNLAGRIPHNAAWNLRRPAICWLCAIAFTSAASCASAAIITLQQGLNSYTHQDTTVRTDGANANATNNTTRNLAGSVGTSTPPGPLRALFSFPLADIPTGSVINSVAFRIGRDPDTGASANADFTVELRSISTTFNEVTANWNNTFGGSMTLGGAALSSTTMNPEGALAVHTFASSPGLVAAVQSAVDASQPFNFSLVAPSAVETGSSRVIFRFGSNTSNLNLIDPQRPTLEIDYTVVPEPASSTLTLVLAAVALMVSRAARSPSVPM